MKFEIFSSIDVRTEINDWLADHPNAKIKFVSQSVATPPTRAMDLIISIFYEEE
ncbi:MAG: hypothetical protein JSW15_07260 [Deltaproteobacteria bacterium]|nr:MAG: hypothetical protein JSW15_07260 [Deltaproteobacteria bacterium]